MPLPGAWGALPHREVAEGLCNSVQVSALEGHPVG